MSWPTLPSPGERRLLIDPNGDGYTHIVSGAAITDFTISGLAAYNADRYVGLLAVKSGATAAVFLDPNGATTGTSYAMDLYTTAAGGARANGTGLPVCNLTAAANTDLFGHFELIARETGVKRGFAAKLGCWDAANETHGVFDVAGFWDLDDALTSLKFRGGASQLTAGTYLKLWAVYDR